MQYICSIYRGNVALIDKNKHMLKRHVSGESASDRIASFNKAIMRTLLHDENMNEKHDIEIYESFGWRLQNIPEKIRNVFIIIRPINISYYLLSIYFSCYLGNQ